MIKDIFRGHSHRAFVILGGQVVLAQNFSIQKNNKGESQSASVVIPLENIDSKIFADTSVSDNNVPVQIWAGYLEDNLDEKEQINQTITEIKKIMNDPAVGQTKNRKFTRRFDGFVSQPEWEFGDSEYLSLDCLDWSSFLREYEFYENFEDGNCEIKHILARLQKDWEGIKIECEPYSGSYRLGEYDNLDNKQTYNCSGRKYWDIIQDCAEKLGYITTLEGRTVKLVYKKKMPLIWPMYYGEWENIKDTDGNPKGQLFKNLRIRWGAKGHIEKSEVIVEVFGTDHKKSGKDRQLRVVFPEDKKITSVNKYIRISVPGDSNKTVLKTIAENRYREEASRIITGTFDIPFANNFIEVDDIVEMVIDKTRPNAEFINGLWFNVAAISEYLSSEGYSQTIEIESDPTLEKTTKKKIAPQNNAKSTDTRLGYTSITDYLMGGKKLGDIHL